MTDKKNTTRPRQVILEHMTMAHIEHAVVGKQMTNRHIDRAVQQQQASSQPTGTAPDSQAGKPTTTTDKK